MYFLVLLLLNYAMVSSGINKTKCKGVAFLDKYYEQEKLFGSLNRPTNLVVHKYTDDLFFSYSDWGAAAPGPKVKRCNIQSRTCKILGKIVNGRAVAYYNKANAIFIGGEGLYKYNHTEQKTYLVKKISGITRIFIYRNFYIICAKLLFMYANKTLFNVPEAVGIEVENFFISRYLSIYISNKTGLYKAERPNDPLYALSNTVRVAQINQDHRTGDVFFATDNGIYIDDFENRKITKVSVIKQAFGITFRYKFGSRFEASQIIYSNYNSIYMLTLSNNSKLCLKKKNRKIAYTPYIPKFPPVKVSLKV